MLNEPRWLQFLSRKLRWLALPNIAILFVTLQILGFLAVFSDPIWLERFVLDPERIFSGEIWRLISFLAIPSSRSPIWILFSVYFLYFVLNSIEAEWGSFKTTFYVLVSYFFAVAFALVFSYPIIRATDFYSTFFLAATALFPNYEIQIYFLIPVKMKYLGWLTLAFLALRFLQGTWLDRFFLITIYSNYLLFFGPAIFARAKQWKRQRDYRSKWRS